MTLPNTKKSRARPATVLPEPLLKYLNRYQLAASAAGVALLACSSPAEGAPVCGSLSVTLARIDTYAFNPAHQKVAPFNAAHTLADLSSMPQSFQARGFFTPNTPDAKAVLSTSGLLANVSAGASIGPGGKFGKGNSYGLVFGYYYFNRFAGNFPSDQSGYVGFQFSEMGQTHYGWLRVRIANVSGENYPSLLLSEYGYESSPATAIAAGNCVASASNLATPPKPQLHAVSYPEEKKSEAPESLGLLALGSEGLPLWRREPLPNAFAPLPISKSYTGD